MAVQRAAWTMGSGDFAPLACAELTIEPASRRLGAWAKSFIPAALIAVAAAAVVGRHENQDADRRFRQAAAQRIAPLRDRIRAALDGLRALGGYLDAGGGVDAAQFTRLTAPLLAHGAPLQALEWIPRVAAAQRARWVAAARAGGLAHFDFTARDARGRLVAEGARPEYDPVYFVNPLAGNAKALGFDVASSPTRRAAMIKAMRSGRMAATARIDLVQETSNRYGFLVFRPVYAGGGVPPTAAQRARTLSGYALGVFRVADLLTGAAPAHASRLRLEVLDDDAPPGRRRLYPMASAGAAAAGTRAVRASLRVAGRRWTVIARPAPGAFAPHRAASTAVLVLGLLAAALWSLAARQRASRMAAIEHAVDVRTRDLDEQRAFSSAIFDCLGGVGLVLDRDGAIVRFNRAAELFTGYTQAEVQGRPLFWKTLLPPEERAAAEAVFHAFEQGRLPTHVEHHWIGRDGDRRLFAWTHTVLADAAGAPRHRVAMGVDVTDRHRAQQLQQALLEHTSAGLLITRRRAVVAANGAMLNMLGIAQHALVGAPARVLYADDATYARVGAAYDALRRAGSLDVPNVRLAGSGGDEPLCDVRAQLLPDGETSVWTFTDVTAREGQALRALRAQGVYRALVAAAQSLLHSATESGMITRLCQSLVLGSEFSAVWLGRPDAGGVFRVVGRASASNQDLSFLDALRVRVTDEGPAIAQAWRAHGVAVHQDNLALQAKSRYAAELRRLQWASTLAAVVDRAGRPWGVLVYVARQVGWFDDTSREACEQVAALLGHGLDELDRKAALADLQRSESRRARTDPLTGLPNRLALGEHLQGALARALRRGTLVAVGVLDLDDFKPVNDRYGHPAGDELLGKLARAMRARLRGADYLARLGGDEFVVLFEDIDERRALDDLRTALERLHTAVELPHELGPARDAVRVGMTMGLALYPQHATEADALLRMADAAMYSGKTHKFGRNQWWSFASGAEAAAGAPGRAPGANPFDAADRVLARCSDVRDAPVD